MNAAEIAVIGTYDSGCSKVELPILGRAPAGPPVTGRPPAGVHQVCVLDDGEADGRGLAALPVVLAALERSDGTRKGVHDARFGARAITVPATASVLGRAFSVGPRTGDVSLRECTGRDRERRPRRCGSS